MFTISQILLFSTVFSSLTLTALSGCDPCFTYQYLTDRRRFEQKNTRFWEFNETSDAWAEVRLPHDLVSCVDGDGCTVVSSIRERTNQADDDRRDDVKEQERELVKSHHPSLPVRKRVSVTKMSENSIWVTGESGMIYERFWNGLQWVVAPHALPVYAGGAASVFLVSQKILALSEAGQLYLMQLNDDSEPIWVELVLEFDNGAGKETGPSSAIQLSAGVITDDKERMYFCTKNGLLLELLEVDPPSWTYHGRPPGAYVAAITNADAIKPGLLFIVGSAGDLYEYDPTTKPPWKKHIRQQGSTKENVLASSKTCLVRGLVGAHSMSLFLLTKGGELIERRLHQRKWRWLVHGNPKGHRLSSITCISQDEPNETSNSLFITTAAGFVFQYRIQKHPEAGNSQDQDLDEIWLSHNHPPHARVARGVAGLQLQFGRMTFALDDGRLAELHLSGLGGESLGPNAPITTRRKSLLKYVWSILDAPETEGWNAEYCTEERGPTNCMLGTKDETGEILIPRWRKDSRTQQSYLIPSKPDVTMSGLRQNYDAQIDKSFRLRVMQEGKSFFLVDNDVTFEYVETENVRFWLTHEHSTGIKGSLGKYNGSLFLVDENGSLLVREKNSGGLMWTNCTAMRKGKQVSGGPPWDGAPGQEPRARPEDAIFFVSRSGRLLQFNVALRKFKWKDCKKPPGIKIASIVDQEGFRESIVFVVGENGRLYQYNRVTGLWHEHYQSQHLVLSRSPGTATRHSPFSLKGSIFMLSEDGGLVEYKWGSADGWNWIEHGQPRTNVTLVGAPGPCFSGSELFLIGSDGNVYLRYLDRGEWKWEDCWFPYEEQKGNGDESQVAEKNGNGGMCNDRGLASGFEKVEEKFRGIDENCDPKVSSTRPIPFSEDAVIFELQDGRLAEMRRTDDRSWAWSRTIATPTSLCMTNLWVAGAS